MTNLSPQARAQLATRAPGRAPKRDPAAGSEAPTSQTSQRARRRRANRSPWSSNQFVLIATGVVLVGLVVVLVVLSRGGFGGGTGGQTPGQLNNSNSPLVAGTRAPDFSLPSAPDGKLVSLSQYHGKVVVLEFFAPWCPNCRNETSVLNTIANSTPDVQVLSVSASPYGFNYEASGATDKTPISMADIKEFVSAFSVSYPALLDTQLKSGNAYGVIGYPQIFVIDRNGTIVWNNGTEGETNLTELQSVIGQAETIPLATPAHAAATPTGSPAH